MMIDIKSMVSKLEEDGKPTSEERALFIRSISNKSLGPIFALAAQEIEALQAENTELKKRSEWISVSDELPEFNTVVLVKVYRDSGITWPKADYSCAAKLSRVTRHCGENSPIDNRWYVFPSGGTEITKDVTHWMPLPTPPKGE